MPTAATHTYLDAIRHLPVGGALSVPGVSWADYQALLAELGDSYAVRITYDRERLEIVSPSDRHEKIKEFICAVAHVLADEMATDLETFGSTTFKHPALKQGAEPDTCFYVQHAAQVIGRDGLDLTVDPPPDVVVEVDVSHSSTAKLSVWAAFGVPEIWRYDGTQTVMYQRSGDGYIEIPASLAFSLLTAEALTDLLQQLRTKGQQAVLTAFRQSLRR